MSQPYIFFINPTAGGGAAREAWPKMEALLHEASLPFEVEVTTSRAQATQRARAWALRPVRALVAVGGDGTVHSIANGLVQATQAGGGYLPLAIVAVGQRNDIAQGLGLPPRKPIAATRRLTALQPHRIDVGWVRGAAGPEGERYFVNGLGIGLDGHLVRVGAAGILARLRALATFQPPSLTLTLHGLTRTQPLTMLTVGNGARHLGDLWLTPDAALDDGQFDLCLVRDMARARLPPLLLAAMRGQHGRQVTVTMERAAHFTVSSPQPLPLHLDGEVVEGVSRIEVELLPSRLTMLI